MLKIKFQEFETLNKLNVASHAEKSTPTGNILIMYMSYRRILLHIVNGKDMNPRCTSGTGIFSFAGTQVMPKNVLFHKPVPKSCDHFYF